MNKPSDRLDFLDKVSDIHNDYIDRQMEIFLSEIKWLDDNYGDVVKLRQYLARFLTADRALELSDDSIKDLAVLRANHLNGQIQQLKSQKISNTPLKVIVQSLKLQGQ